jgi:hypothetical protein
MRKKQSAGKAGDFFGQDGPTGRGGDYEIKGRRLIARQYRNPDRVVIAFEPFCMQQFHQGHSKICCVDYHIDVEPCCFLRYAVAPAEHPLRPARVREASVKAHRFHTQTLLRQSIVRMRQHHT